MCSGYDYHSPTGLYSLILTVDGILCQISHTICTSFLSRSLVSKAMWKLKNASKELQVIPQIRSHFECCAIACLIKTVALHLTCCWSTLLSWWYRLQCYVRKQWITKTTLQSNNTIGWTTVIQNKCSIRFPFFLPGVGGGGEKLLFFTGILYLWSRLRLKSVLDENC